MLRERKRKNEKQRLGQRKRKKKQLNVNNVTVEIVNELVAYFLIDLFARLRRLSPARDHGKEGTFADLLPFEKEKEETAFCCSTPHSAARNRALRVPNQSYTLLIRVSFAHRKLLYVGRIGMN